MELSALVLGEQALRHAWPMHSDWHWDITILQWRQDQRLVADCTLCDAGTQRARQRVIVKWYGDTMGGTTFALMQFLDALLEAPKAGLLAAPRPLFYVPAARMLVQEAVRGTSYRDLLKRRRYRHYLQQAGRALELLHRLPAVDAPRRKRLDDHMNELMRPHPLVLADAVPVLRVRIENLVATMLRIEASWNDAPAVAWLHRDFHIGQLFYGQRRVWVIDWDLASFGDPALDVGNFLHNLDKHLEELAPAGRAAFVEGYLENGDADVLRRASLYEGFTCLRRACKAMRERRPGWQSDVTRLVCAGEACVSRL
ncbi:aminoglycoside phosphotransferase family protein [Burkholderia ubonensis]|nr:aminoglycoside phosphotransferase family protein [Burkholderia ubonensis]KVG85662.1 hypothetical protein WJ36_05625 [Burkholderia ubonensis]KVH49598.1 hypothetical protein WJ38_14825 [Burkholderia ubonensis]